MLFSNVTPIDVLYFAATYQLVSTDGNPIMQPKPKKKNMFIHTLSFQLVPTNHLPCVTHTFKMSHLVLCCTV